MKRLFNAKPVLAAAFAVGALAVTSAAHARSDVVFSIGFQAPYGDVEPAPFYKQPRPVYVQPQTVYVQPQPVYVQPQPVYVQPQPVYVQPQSVYLAPQQPVHTQHQSVYPVQPYHPSHRSYGRRGGPWGDADRDGVPNIYDRDSRFYDGRAAHHAGFRRDADRDGVPNRFDREPNNRYRY